MTLLELSKSALLTIGAAGALYPRRRPVFRWMVVAYAWAAIGLSLLVGLGAALGAFRLARELDLAAAAYVYLGQLESSLLRMAYPAILLWIMARPTVKARYHGGHVMGQGFEPIWPSARSDG